MPDNNDKIPVVGKLVHQGNDNQANKLVEVFIPKKIDDNPVPDDNEKIPAVSESAHKQKICGKSLSKW